MGVDLFRSAGSANSRIARREQPPGVYERFLAQAPEVAWLKGPGGQLFSVEIRAYSQRFFRSETGIRCRSCSFISQPRNSRPFRRWLVICGTKGPTTSTSPKFGLRRLPSIYLRQMGTLAARAT